MSDENEHTPSVSVIIPTHNRCQMLKNAIQSVLDQTYEDMEVIVVDDASDDATRDIIDGFPDE